MDSIKNNPNLGKAIEAQITRKNSNASASQKETDTNPSGETGIDRSEPLGIGWAQVAGGIKGMSAIDIKSNNIKTPGHQAMEAIKAAESKEIGNLGNGQLISVKNNPRANGNSFEITPDEVLTVCNTMKNKNPENMIKELKKNYGMDCSIVEIEGDKGSQKAVKNNSTGHVIYVNNSTGIKDANFENALGQLKSVGANTTAGVEATEELSGIKEEKQVENLVNPEFPDYGLWSNPTFKSNIQAILTGAVKYSRMFK